MGELHWNELEQAALTVQRMADDGDEEAKQLVQLRYQLCSLKVEELTRRATEKAKVKKEDSGVAVPKTNMKQRTCPKQTLAVKKTLPLKQTTWPKFKARPKATQKVAGKVARSISISSPTSSYYSDSEGEWRECSPAEAKAKLGGECEPAEVRAWRRERV